MITPIVLLGTIIVSSFVSVGLSAFSLYREVSTAATVQKLQEVQNELGKGLERLVHNEHHIRGALAAISETTEEFKQIVIKTRFTVDEIEKDLSTIVKPSF